MTEEEKSLWKIRVFRECEIVDHEIEEKLEIIEEERKKVQETIKSSNHIISTFNATRAKERVIEFNKNEGLQEEHFK
jgi:hypothetical protein